MTHDIQGQCPQEDGKPRSASAAKAAPFASDSPSRTGRVGGRHYADEIKQAARGLYLKRHTVAEIAAALSVPKRTVYYWAEQGQWDDLLCHEGAEEAAHRRLALLVEREGKSTQDLKELDALVSTLERLQRLRERALTARGMEGQLVENQPGENQPREQSRAAEGRKGQGGRKKPPKNDVSKLTGEDFATAFHKYFFDFQHGWRASRLEHRNRALLKSRQIGATWYFAQEAFEDACLTGDNQIFLSATRKQSEVFRSYIVGLAAEKFDLELKGNPLILNTAHGPAELHFLSNNSKSAQSYHGHVYIDEFFWITKFKELFKVATAMAAHKKWRRTVFSTPSALTHEAYAFWSGEDFQQRFARRKPWPTAEELRAGVLCPDRWWRQVVTLADAEAGGCHLFDVEQLKLEYSPEAFRQLFGCEFIDDAQSVFSLALLERCMVDTAEWKDVDRAAMRPVGSRTTWGGYDPARSGDNASCATLLAPQKADDSIRLLEKLRWQGQSYLWQTERIRELANKYSYSHFGVDTTGPGIGVFENVRQFIPQATAVHYSPQIKAQLVLKALEVMEQGRFQFDASDIDLAHAFMTIKKTTTDSGQITYTASRNSQTGHADEAWSVMHALAAEPLARQYGMGGCELALG